MLNLTLKCVYFDVFSVIGNVLLPVYAMLLSFKWESFKFHEAQNQTKTNNTEQMSA